MTLKTWLKFVEIQSLVASVLPLVLGNLYAAVQNSFRLPE